MSDKVHGMSTVYVYGLTRNDFVFGKRLEPTREGRLPDQWTPIQESNLTLNGNALFFKRDDLLPFSFGGNKARKAVHFSQILLSRETIALLHMGVSDQITVGLWLTWPLRGNYPVTLYPRLAHPMSLLETA